MESMISHKVQQIIFASQDSEIMNALLIPKALPSFRYYVSELMNLLSNFPIWKVEVESFATNRCATHITQIIISQDRLQSYVALSFPSWLREIFVNESLFASA